MEIYNDYELNRIANEIIAEIDNLSQSMGSMMGHSTEVDSHEAQRIMTKVLETPTSFANELFSRNLRKLNTIKNSVGYNDETFEQLSEGLAMAVIGIINFPIENANMITMASDFRNSLNDPDVIKLKRNITESASILSSLSQLKISPNVKHQISNLQGIIKILEKKFNPSSGCYIATYVYGDYDAPEVIKLRLFRDSNLSNFWIGKQIIELYYFLSPKLISVLGDNQLFKRISKRILDTIIKTLRY